ncbi:hypothetical protein CWI75_14110 [Kineobactrum sediminis]|uniref:Transporter n=1 Tax=Kineobactrum sediminis TaxID=1905677 RepID=A0A2N5Y0F3_9GAMM|nr:hypothetical protein [Kineobactrum sediminis]PLW81871.1 hypothetical protein CWI75_14110 [Kineobactrum sediminis]
MLLFASHAGVAPYVGAQNLDLESELTKQMQLINQQNAALQQQQKLLEAQQREIEQLKRILNGIQQQRADATIRPQPGEPVAPVGKAPDIIKKSAVPDIPTLDNQVARVLTNKGGLVLEPYLQYSYADNNRVFLDAFTFLPALAIGLIDLRQVKRHSTITGITARYGLSSRLELETRVRHVYRSDSQRSRPISIGVGDDEIFNADGNGFGDTELAARYQLNDGVDGWPIFIGSLTASLPTGSSPFDVDFVQSTPGALFPTELHTGSGYLSLQPAVSVLYPTDPAVFFGSLSYSWNKDTDEEIAGARQNVDPGDSLGIGFGMGFAFNERSSFSIGYSHKHVLESKVGGADINGSVLDIGALTFGFSLRANQHTRFNLSLSVGTTEDAQDVDIALRMPTSLF